MSGNILATLFAIFESTLHTIAVDSIDQPDILTVTFYLKNEFLFHL